MGNPGPLTGVRVIEMGQLIAGPFAGHMLAYFGAEVIKIETPGKGDPIRGWRLVEEGTSYWWRSLARNKHSVTLNLNEDAGRDIARQLILQSDVLVENFRPGKMESWSLGPEDFIQEKPSLVYTRVSGYGQTGPYRNKPGFASACEAMGGFRHINGFADRPPVRPNLSMGDTLAGMHAVIGTLMALFHRQTQPEGKGQVVDVSILESVYSMLESVVPEYSGAGVVRQPSGSTLTGIVPTNTYLCRDDKYVVIGGNGDSIFKRLMRAAGRADLADDPRLADNAGRVTHEAEIDAALSEWTQSDDTESILRQLDQADVPSAPIYSVEDMVDDPHFRERGMFETVSYQDRELEVPAVHPRLQTTPGGTRWAGPELGEHTQDILTTVLDYDADQLAQLRLDGII